MTWICLSQWSQVYNIFYSHRTFLFQICFQTSCSLHVQALPVFLDQLVPSWAAVLCLGSAGPFHLTPWLAIVDIFRLRFAKTPVNFAWFSLLVLGEFGWPRNARDPLWSISQPLLLLLLLLLAWLWLWLLLNLAKVLVLIEPAGSYLF